MPPSLTVRRALRHFLVFLLWNVAAGLLILPGISPFPAPVGLLLALAVTAVFFRGYVLWPRREAAARRWALLRLRPLSREGWRWTLVAAPVLLALSWSLGEVYIRLVRVPADNLDPFGGLFDSPLERLTLAVFAIAVAPLLEEFFFRGLIQRPLERRFGAAAGILLAGSLFALVHGLLWIFPLYLLLGAAFGFAVYATRSIWAGVVLHAANNSVAMLGIGMRTEEVPVVPTLWEAGPTPDWWLSLGMLAVSAIAAVWVARGMWQSRNAGTEPPRFPS